ncbi:Noc2-domain-containing protein [Clavulina sp. PMI_390]|nr:Noc2-domain-containing protein [Clavulina sp. PMI_390]
MADDAVTSKGKFSGMTVDDLLSGNFMDEDDNSEDEGNEGVNDDDDYASLDELEEDEETHKMELAALAEKDPEFFKYLQENDKELLNFTAPAAPADADSDDGGFALDGEDVDMDSDEDEDEESPVLTLAILKGWQRSIIETRSLRSLRKLLLAFRSAARMNDEEAVSGWKIEEASVFNKLVVTAFKYTPVVLQHHLPYKILPNGKFKAPAQNAKFKALQKLVLSYFLTVIHFVSELSDAPMQQLAVQESAKLIPYVISSRKAIRNYLKMCFDLWSSAADEVRLAALLAMRSLVGSQDDSIVDLVLRGSYMALVRSCKSTSAHTLPSINLMKNSAAELYVVDPSTAYQHAFGFIRQLAVHLRNSMKVKSKEAYKQVYNWQFVHSVDFWALVLAKACDAKVESDSGEASELKPLIYPLIQVTLGAIKLIPTARYYPLHLQLLRSLLHIIQRTGTYLSLAPFLVPIITASLSPSSSSAKPKSAALRPLDMTLHIRAPAQYLKTKSYAESTAEEALFVLGSWAECVQGSVAFPEVVLPAVLALRKALKKAHSSGGGKGAANGKIVSMVKTLVERIEEGSKWVSSKRDNVTFAPANQTQVQRWESEVKVEETPVGKYMRVQRKTREKKQAMLEKARQGEGEVLDSD